MAQAGMVLTLPGGILMGPDGAVVTADGKVLHETLWSADLFGAGFPPRRRTRRPRLEPLMAASLVAPWHGNWFHWVLNTLPRQRVLQAAGMDRLPVIIPEKLSAARRRSLEAVGIDLRSAITYGRTPLAVETLVWPSSATHAYYASSSSAAWLRERVLSGLHIRRRSRRRLYISRPTDRPLPLPRGYPRRAIVNEAEVIDVLRGRGFEVVRPEKLSFDDQVRLFCDAEAVVAPHGAGSVNIVFSEHAALIELFEPQFVDPGPFAVATAAGHDYWFSPRQAGGRGRHRSTARPPRCDRDRGSGSDRSMRPVLRLAFSDFWDGFVPEAPFSRRH